jgi:hypothetical protein
MKTPLDVLDDIKVPPRRPRTSRKAGLSYFEEGGGGTSDGGSDSGGGGGGDTSGGGGSSTDSNGVSDPGESASNAADAAAADAAAAAAAANSDFGAATQAEADAISSALADAFDAAQGAAVGDGTGFTSGLDAAAGDVSSRGLGAQVSNPDVADAAKMDAQIAANTASPLASTMTPAQIEAAMVAMSPATSYNPAGTIGGGKVSGMYNDNLSYSELAGLQAMGAGKQDVPGNEDQTIDQALASRDFHGFATEYGPSIVGALSPTFSAMQTFANIAGGLLSGKSTVGEAVTSGALAVAANQLGVPVGVVSGMINGDFGQVAANTANSALASAIASATGLSPGLVGLGMNVSGIGKEVGSGISNAVNSATGAPTSSNLGSLSGFLDSVLSGVGVPTGGAAATPSSTSPSSGGSSGGGGGGIQSGDFGNVSSNTTTGGSNSGGSNSGGSNLGGLSLAALAALMGGGSGGTSGGTSGATATPPKGDYRTVGKMETDPMQKSLQALNLDEGLTPEYKYVADAAPLTVDVNKAMLAGMGLPTEYPLPYAPTEYPSLYAAQGGLVQHFAEGDAVTDSVKKLESQYATADIAKALKELGAIGTDMKPPQHNMRAVRDAGMPYSPKVLPRLAALLQARGMTLADGGQPSDAKHPNYDGTPVFRTGGLEGLGGKYVEGKGDGTSDDISAMLANGEYVFSADVVSALGNGSNKAGAERLGEMVKAIRERARSAPPDKLPPDAKSPLEYLKSPKGNKHG